MAVVGGFMFNVKLLVGVSLVFRAEAASTQPTAAPSECVVDSARTLAKLHGLTGAAGIPGGAIAIINRGRLTTVDAFGYADSAGTARVDTNTVFEAASLSKPVIAYATLKLVDRGRLNLDVPLSHYLAYPDLPHDTRSALITARMVLSHTTGLQNERIGNDTLTLSFTPGSRFQYSGEGYIYLGRVIEKLMQAPLAAAIEELVFKPLRMRRSSFVWEKRFDSNAAVGHGSFGEPRRPTRPVVARAPSSLHTTALDYATFLIAVLKGTGLTRETWRAMMSPAISVAPGVSWGLGWGLENGSAGSVLWHHGDNSNSGFTAFALANASQQCGLAYFANSVSGLSIAKDVAAILNGTHPSVGWMGYEYYTAPGAVLRRRLGQTLLTAGAAAAINVYRQIEGEKAAGATEGLLNSAGYLLLGRGDVPGAILIFRENVRAYPASANVYDSLGDAYLAARQDSAALDAYARSVALDPANSHARHLVDSLRTVTGKSRIHPATRAR